MQLKDDQGVAGVIGVVLVLAVLVTAYGNAVRTDLPAYGADAERAWDDAVGSALRQFGRAMADGLTAGAPMAATLPPQPEPRALDVPLLGRAAPLPASALVSFVPGCASLTATHALADGSEVTDLRAGSTGCLRFQSEPVYSAPFAYRVELGGVLRVQGERAVVLAGPALELDATTPTEYRVAIGVPGLRGEPATTSVGAGGVRIDLVSGPYAGEIEQAPNAGSAKWRLETAYPDAWRTWLETRFDASGFVEHRVSPGAGESPGDYAITCSPADCSRGPDGTGIVEVTIHGPRTDTPDLKLSVTYSLFDVNVR